MMEITIGGEQSIQTIGIGLFIFIAFCVLWSLVCFIFWYRGRKKIRNK